jgi:hypothetical protein
LADELDSEPCVISVLGPPAAAHPMLALTSYHHHSERLPDELRSHLIQALHTRGPPT